MYGRAPDEPLFMAGDEESVGEAVEFVEHLTAPVFERSRGDRAERRLIDARCGVQLVDPPERLVALASAQLRQRFDANAERHHGLLGGR